MTPTSTQPVNHSYKTHSNWVKQLRELGIFIQESMKGGQNSLFKRDRTQEVRLCKEHLEIKRLKDKN